MKLRSFVAASIVLASSSAFAQEHQMRVGEVLLSNQGSTASQYIELQDPGESFPGAYSLKIFNAAGGSLGSIALTVPSGTTRLLVATTTAATQFGVTAQATLNIALPANGQACFANASANIHCLAWGTVGSTIPGTSGNGAGASPPDGMSLQVVSGVYTVATPTPGAANSAVLPDASPGVDAGVDAPPGMADAAPGVDAPTGNPNNPKDDEGCSVGAGASWFAIVGLAGLVMLRRRPRG